MKLLILISLSIASLNIFSAELGEDKKSPCPYANQSSKREAKLVIEASGDIVKKEVTKVISK